MSNSKRVRRGTAFAVTALTFGPVLGAVMAQPALAATPGNASSVPDGLARQSPGTYGRMSVAQQIEVRQQLANGAFSLLRKRVRETPMGSNVVPLLDRIAKSSREPWCAKMISVLHLQAGVPFKGGQVLGEQPWDLVRTQGQHSLIEWYQNHGQYWDKSAQSVDPQPGDSVFIYFADQAQWHVGMVVRVTGDTLETIEGNRGDAVRKETYRNYRSDPRIRGFGSLFPTDVRVSDQIRTPGRHAKATVVIMTPVSKLLKSPPPTVVATFVLSQPIPSAVLSQSSDMATTPTPTNPSDSVTPVMPLVPITASPLSALADSVPTAPVVSDAPGSASPGPSNVTTTPTPSDGSTVAASPPSAVSTPELPVVPATAGSESLSQLGDAVPTVTPSKPVITPNPSGARVTAGSSQSEVMRQLPSGLSQKTVDLVHYCWRLHSYALAAGKAHGFPPSLLLAANLTPEDILLADAYEESHCRPGAVQPGGLGRGPWQMDLGQHPEYKGGLDTMANAMAAAKLLRSYIHQFEGMGLPPVKALRAGIDAYNAGVGGTKRCMREGHDPDSCTTNKHYGTHILDNAIRIHYVLVYLGLED